MLLSQFVPLSPFPHCVCSLCLHLYSCLANKFINTIFSRVHMHALIYICFSLSERALFIAASRFIHLTRTDSNSFLFMAQQYSILYIYIPQLLYLFICEWTPRLFHVLAIVNSAAMNIGVHVSFWTMAFSGCRNRTLFDINHSKILVNTSPRVIEMKTKTNGI